MSFNELPPEVVDRILDYLDTPNLFVLRYISRVWDQSARARLFRKITFTPTDANEAGIKDEMARILKARSDHTFKSLFGRSRHNPKAHSYYRRLAMCVQIINEDRLRDFVRELVVKSTPISGLYSSWEEREDSLLRILEDWKERDQTYEAYYKGLRNISNLPELETVHVQFLPLCDHQHQTKVESFYHRRKILECVFESLSRRKLPTRTLTIENLRNQPEPEVTGSKAFQQCMSGIEELNLTVAQSGYGFDDDGAKSWGKNLFKFMPHLTECWLIPVSQQLKSLSLCFDTYWGPLPGFFDVSDVEFPFLENLTLGLYVVAHDDALDWVLGSKSLRSLQLRLCPILAEVCLLEGDELDHKRKSKSKADKQQGPAWNLRTHDWRQMASDLVLYRYDQTWSYFLERIGKELPVLRRFGLQFEAEKKDRRKTIEEILEFPHRTASVRGSAYIQFDQSRTADGSDHWTRFDRSLPTYGAEKAGDSDVVALGRLIAVIKQRRDDILPTYEAVESISMDVSEKRKLI